MQHILHRVLHLGEHAHLQPDGERIRRTEFPFPVLRGTAQCQHAEDLLLRHLGRRPETKIHVVERAARTQIDAHIGQTRLGIEVNRRQERLHLVERRRPLADLEHRPQIADRVAAPHADHARCLRVTRCSAEVDLPRRMHIVEIRAEEMHMPTDRHPHIENDMRQFTVRIGNRWDRDERTVDIDRPRYLRQRLAPVGVLRQLQRARQGAVVERRLDRECIHHEHELIVRGF